MTGVTRFLKLLLIGVLGVITLTSAAIAVAPRVVDLATASRSERAGIDLDPLSERSYVYDRKGVRMATFVAEENRVQVPIAEVPRPVIDAVLAAEDSSFYTHKGVNVRSIGRALGANIEQGGVAQGGSTISQQVVKNSITGGEQDIARKIEEAVLATELEDKLTKDQILERYLNSVYLGNGAYGVQAAAEVYFGKDVGRLGWPEAALLAGMIRCPVSCDPFRHAPQARRRRSTVLDSLVVTRRLTRAPADISKLVPLPRQINLPRRPDDYFVEAVKQQLLDDERLGPTPTARYNRLFGGGLRVYTTFDSGQYYEAIRARNETLPENRGDATFDLGPDPATGRPRFGTAAMAGVEPTTGAVRFVLGGPGFGKYKFDLAIQGEKQPGSSMKTFVLTQAILDGHSPFDTVDGSGPCRGIPGYADDDPPGNFGNSRGGVATLISQTLKSSNCAFLRLNQIVGPRKVADLARRMGITTPLHPENGSFALGTDPVHPLDMAAAYSVLANDGVRNPAYFIDRVTDASGDVLFAHRPAPERILPENVARTVNAVLEMNVKSGTATRATLINGQPAAGKTGTTNNAYNVWFVGYTPQLSVSVWMGAAAGDVSLSFGGGATGGRYPAATWGLFMNRVLAGSPTVSFPDPILGKGGTCLKLPGASCYSGSGRGSGGRSRSGRGGR